MFRSLVCEMRMWPTLWRRKIELCWLLRDAGSFGFFAMFALPIVAIALIVYFSFEHRTQVDLAQVTAAEQRELDIHCLAENVYFEARGEPLLGQYAVAEVTLNRLASPDFPHTICEVVHDRRWDSQHRRRVAHFSWTVLNTDVLPDPSGPAWDQAMTVATRVYDKTILPIVPGALYYHSNSVRPYWAQSKRVVAKIGNHIFYR